MNIDTKDIDHISLKVGCSVCGIPMTATVRSESEAQSIANRLLCSDCGYRRALYPPVRCADPHRYDFTTGIRAVFRSTEAKQ